MPAQLEESQSDCNSLKCQQSGCSGCNRVEKEVPCVRDADAFLRHRSILASRRRAFLVDRHPQCAEYTLLNNCNCPFEGWPSDIHYKQKQFRRFYIKRFLYTKTLNHTHFLVMCQFYHSAKSKGHLYWVSALQRRGSIQFCLWVFFF